MTAKPRTRLSSTAISKLEAKKQEGMRWGQIAREAGISSELLHKMRRGERGVSLETAERLSHALGLKLQQVYEKNISELVQQY